jgi:hypothetical protein
MWGLNAAYIGAPAASWRARQAARLQLLDSIATA